MNTNLIKLELEGQIVGYRQLGKDGRFHMVPNMPWDWGHPPLSYLCNALRQGNPIREKKDLIDRG
jgi:hypothetical protein